MLSQIAGPGKVHCLIGGVCSVAEKRLGPLLDHETLKGAPHRGALPVEYGASPLRRRAHSSLSDSLSKVLVWSMSTLSQDSLAVLTLTSETFLLPMPRGGWRAAGTSTEVKCLAAVVEQGRGAMNGLGGVP